MPDNDEVVYFLMPDGTEVSNDPRYHDEKYREHLLAQMENTGNAVEVRLAGTNEDEDDLDEEDGDETQEIERLSAEALHELTKEQLSAYAKSLKAAGVDFSTRGIKTKEDLINAILAAS